MVLSPLPISHPLLTCLTLLKHTPHTSHSLPTHFSNTPLTLLTHFPHTSHTHTSHFSLTSHTLLTHFPLQALTHLRLPAPLCLHACRVQTTRSPHPREYMLSRHPPLFTTTSCWTSSTDHACRHSRASTRWLRTWVRGRTPLVVVFVL